jgi:hypothetical protein
MTIVESEEQRPKQELSTTSTLAGREIDCNEEQSQNAHSPSRVNFDPDSMMIVESEEQLLKQ